MTFKKKAPKPPKATLDDLLQSGAVKTGKQLVKDQEAKVKEAAEFDQAVQDELSNRKSKGRG
jgi:hypothetical protein